MAGLARSPDPTSARFHFKTLFKERHRSNFEMPRVQFRGVATTQPCRSTATTGRLAYLRALIPGISAPRHPPFITRRT